MKRYDIAMYTNLDGISSLRVYKSSNGEWVKYVDIMGTFHEPIIRKPPDTSCLCNCYEYSQVKMGKSCVGIGWICPAHGYKKR